MVCDWQTKRKKKKKWEWVEQRGENQPGQNGIDEEKAPAEKIYETVCSGEEGETREK